jgi:transcriptional regulator with XRE-family HTH domain
VDFNQRVGARVKQYRQAAGVSQTQLATVLSTLGMPFHQQAIVRVERGQRPLRLEEALAVAENLGIDMALLLYDTSDAEKLALEEQIQDLLGGIADEREVIAECERKIKHYETQVQRAQERLRQR